MITLRDLSTKKAIISRAGVTADNNTEVRLRLDTRLEYEKVAFNIQQWKRRFFVLRKPSGSLPDQYELHYYKDEKCAAKKGSIDLEQCEQIIESLDSELFPYLLAIKTFCKNKVRTYYLAVDSEQEMSSWVQWLCHVCGMKQEDEPTDLPEPRSPTVTAPTQGSIGNGRPWNHPSAVTTSPSTVTTNSNMATNPSVNLSHRVPSESSLDSSPSYIPLDDCTTGQPQPKRVGSSESVESVPDFNAPSPPVARGTQQDTGGASGNEDDVFVGGSYVRAQKAKEPAPPPRSAASMDLNTVPPVRPPRPKEKEDHSGDDDKNSSYDIPPPRRRQSPKRSTDSRKDSFSSSGGRNNPPSESYDYPPPRLSTSSDGDLAPADHQNFQPSPYQNIPPTGKSSVSSGGASSFDLNTVVPPPRAHQSSNQNQGYDIPRSSKQRPSQATQPKLSTVPTPPPPRPHRPCQGAHAYLNTQDGPADSDLNYTNVSASPPAIPPPRHHSNSDQHDGSPKSGVYHIPPPSSASSSSSASSAPPARPPARTTPANPPPPPIAARNPDIGLSQNQDKGEDGGAIFSTQRTRSFKKQHNINIPIKASNKANTLPMATAPVPAPRPVQPPRPSNYSSSEDGDEETTHHPISLLRSVPPPFDAEPELKYIDLELPDSTVQDAPKSQQSHHHHSHHSHAHNHAERSKPDSSIEYREIDFVKTKALKETKEEKDRQNDDHNA